MPCQLGFHLRVISRFIKHSKRFSAEIRIRKGKITVDGKNVMGLLLLAAAWKSKLYIEAEGHDAEEAIARIKSFFQTEESTHR
jgi:phosphotransferase system HPr (HPr) family protein